MSKILLTLAHPNPESLNAAIADAVEAGLKARGHQVRRNDVCQKDFDPVLGMADFEAWGKGQVPPEVKREQDDIAWADGLAFVFPIWWHEQPAKLKGWIDRTLTKGFAWDFTETGRVGLLEAKKAFVAVTYGSPVPVYDELDIDRDVIKQPMVKGTLNFCGISNVRYVEEFGVLMQDRSANEAYVERVAKEALDFFGAA